MRKVNTSEEMPYTEMVSKKDREKFNKLVPNFLIYCHNQRSKDKYAVDPGQIQEIIELIQSRQDWEIEAFAAYYIASAPTEVAKVISLPWLLENLMRFGQLHEEEDSDLTVTPKKPNIKAGTAFNSPPLVGDKLSDIVTKNVEANKLMRQELDLPPGDFWKMLESLGKK